MMQRHNVRIIKGASETRLTKASPLHRVNLIIIIIIIVIIVIFFNYYFYYYYCLPCLLMLLGEMLVAV